MKITAVRIRVLRSRSAAYGHDAAEFEAQLEDGDDPVEVAAALRAMCETEVRQGAEQARVTDRIGDLYGELRGLEDQVAGGEKRVKGARETLRQFDAFIQAAKKAGVHVPQALESSLIPL